jgi:bifunctional non-homologous end joining protein LigD
MCLWLVPQSRISMLVRGGVTADEMREMQWVKPELVAQIRFVEWTAEGRLRHAAFLGLRSDKSAREVRREMSEDTTR